MNKSVAYLLILSLACDILFANNTDKEEKKKLDAKKAKMDKFMKDLHQANNLLDLSKYGLNAPLMRSSVRVAPILGRSDYKGKSIAEETIEATPGKCDPKPVCISNPLTLNINSTQFAFPPCINIHRCDGCCPTNENCVAIGQHLVKLHKVGIISFDGESTPVYDETSVLVSNHTECQCQCKWKTDADCRVENANLIRNPQACECTCPEEMYCDAFHQFDKESCKCKCRQDIYSRLEQNCGARGFFWNDNNCKCDTTKRVQAAPISREVRIIGRGSLV